MGEGGDGDKPPSPLKHSERILANQNLRVTFAIGEKTFIFPVAFKMGFLKMKE